MHVRFAIFMVGFLIGLFVQDSSVWVLLVLGLGGAVGRVRDRMKGNWIVLLMGIGLGVLRMIVADLVLEDDVRLLAGQEVSMTACIGEEVDVREAKVKYIVDEICVVADGGGCLARGGRVLLDASRYPVFEYGDVVEVSGFLEIPENFEGFDYRRYLARYGVFSMMSQPRITKVGDGCGLGAFEQIFRFKGRIEERLVELFSEPSASMMAGLLLGSRKGIPAELTEDFNETGLTHIVAISGYNITLVIIVVFGLFGFLSRKVRVIAAVVFVAVFVVLVGASSAVVRAGIMGVVSLFAMYFGRRGEVFISIVFAAFVMNLVNPRIAVVDVGFQLSFLATLGLVYVSPLLEKAGGVFGRMMKRVPAAFLIRENFLMTLSAQAFALPVILKSFGRISLICPIANIFVLPFVPFAMICGFFAIFFSFVPGGGFLAEIFAFAGYVVLELVFVLIGFFADLSRML
jgi:competence protein ComEC